MADATGICDTTYGFGYVCRFARHTFIANKNKAVSSFVYAAGPSAAGDDVIAKAIIDGVECSANRMSSDPGVTGIASASCVQWVPPGTHVIDLVIISSTGVMLKAGTYFRAGVVVF